ncbi:MAG: flagellar biosynthesis protein FlhB [Hyphomonas sp.]|jgi:flagellar biosynthetic protein FlhB
MAEQNQDSAEKEFEATEQRLRQAREEGNVPQSKEANAFALVLGIIASAFILHALVGKSLFEDLASMLYHGDAFSRDVFTDDGSATWVWLAMVLLHLLPVFIVLALLIFIALVVQRAISFSFKKISLDMQKLSPAENLKKRYGTRGLTDFLKDTAKMLFAGLIGAVFLVQFFQDYYASTAVELGNFYEFTFSQVLKLIFYFLVFQAFLAVIDLPLQRQLHLNKLRMTREEMKKEMKQSEGDPQMKQQRREKASKISRGQMLQNVKTATVVMVNPTHYAVALKWDPASNRAPVCVAKGADHLAARIREIAQASNIPIYSDPPATRSLYRLVEVDEEIRPEHFAAVAAAIQFVERTRAQT